MANLDHDELSLIGSFEFDFSDRDEWRQLVEKIAFSLVSPIVLPGRSLMCVVMILFCSFELGLSLVLFVASPLFFYVASKCLISGYQKKGLLRSI